MCEQKNIRLQWVLSTAFLLFIFIIVPQSCSNDMIDDYEKNPKISENLISLSKCADIEQFIPKAKTAASKFLEYTNTLSDNEFSELMNNLNNDEYMLTVIKDANIEAELQSIEKEIKAIHQNLEYMDLDTSDKLVIFTYLEQENSVKIMSSRLRSGSESEKGRRCQEQYDSDEKWAVGIYLVALAACSCAVGSGVGAPAGCLCFTAAIANYANDMRLATRNYEDCMSR